MENKKEKFVPPDRKDRDRALGELKGDRKCVQKALDNIDKYWTQIRAPKSGDWLYPYGHKGQTFDMHKGKKITPDRCTLYIQPLVYKDQSLISDKLLDNMKRWLEAFYYPCKVKILPFIFEKLLQERGVHVKKNDYDCNQYNAVGILNLVIGPIQKSLTDAIGVISFSDIDLYTDRLSNYCFGYGIPALGGVQSIRRFMPEWTDEEYDNYENFESWMMLRVFKIATHEIGHMFGLMHCIYYNCLMMGTNGLWQTDQNPIYFCPVCYRKLFKCLGFNHVDRYKKLSDMCKEFGGAFMEKQKWEVDKKSVGKWFEIRYNDLEGKILLSDMKVLGGDEPVARGIGGRLAVPLNNNKNNRSLSDARSKSPCLNLKVPGAENGGQSRSRSKSKGKVVNSNSKPGNLFK